MSTVRVTSGRPLWAECRRCRYRWVFTYVPVPLAAVVQKARRATCPGCGATTDLYLAPHRPGHGRGVLVEHEESR